MNKAVSANNGEFHTEVCVENICIQKRGPGKIQDLPWNAVKMYISGKRRRSIMATITMEVPEDIMNFMVCENKCDELRRNALLLYPFIKNETISHGRAAEILGISKWELIELYGNEGIPYIDQSWEEVEQDAANVKALLSKR